MPRTVQLWHGREHQIAVGISDKQTTKQFSGKLVKFWKLNSIFSSDYPFKKIRNISCGCCCKGSSLVWHLNAWTYLWCLPESPLPCILEQSIQPVPQFPAPPLAICSDLLSCPDRCRMPIWPVWCHYTKFVKSWDLPAQCDCCDVHTGRTIGYSCTH